MNERMYILESIDEAQKSGARLKAAVDIVGISLRTLERWKKEPKDDNRKDNRFSTSNALTAEEKKVIRETICLPQYRDLSPNQIVPILAEKGLYIGSESTMYRLMKKEGLQVYRGRSRAPERKRPDEYVATKPNQIWTWDITYLPSERKGEYFYLYLMMDIWDRSIVGWSVHDRESGKLAAELLNQTCFRNKVDEGSLIVHQDNGTPMTSSDFLKCLSYWGQPSYSRPGVSDDNPYSESLFKHLKYNHRYPIRFETIESARKWMQSFVEHYNSQHRHSGISFVTPNQRRTGEDKKILEVRISTYKKAQARNPHRWSRQTRQWKYTDKVTLNPRSKKKDRQSAA